MASTTANTQLLGSTRVSSRHTTARRSVAASACCSQSQRAGSLSAKLALGGRSAQALRTAAFLGSASPLSAARRGALSVFAGKKVLIVNTPSGAHAPLGFYLAKQLQAAGHSVTIMTSCAADSDKLKKPPFAYWGELTSAGVSAVFGDSVSAAIPAGATFDVVVDNNGKDMDAVGPVIEAAKAAKAEQFVFVSSAGMYKTSDEVPFLEGDKVKEDAGHALVEEALRNGSMKWASFRPQYLTGYGSNKDCEEWFFDRIARGRPVPIPGSGVQLTVVAHSEDIAAMIALAITKPDVANGKIFNAVSDRAVSLDGMARMCAKAAGMADKLKIVHYDPKKADVDVKKAFPFRPVHFYSEPRNARTLLGWAPKWRLEDALAERWAFYQKSGRATKDKAGQFDLDDQIISKV